MNPYKVLNITPEATPKDIVQASALALRNKEYSARDIAEARKRLMNPADRLVLDFVYSVDQEPLMKNTNLLDDVTEKMIKDKQLNLLKRLDIFDSQI